MRLSLFVSFAAAVFVWLSSASLPGLVASHFNAEGVPDGFMSRGAYVAVMLSVVVATPLLVAFLGRWVSTLPDESINLPNKRHWLGPQHREASLAYLSAWLSWSGAAVAALLSYIHWQVVAANARVPPTLDERSLWLALALALASLIIGLAALFRRFGRVT